MPKQRKRTMRDDPLERRIYEEAGKEQETFLVLECQELLEDLPKPRGWQKRNKPGRPRKKRRGRQEEFAWRPMVIVLLLKTLHNLDYRGMASHLRANPGLCETIGLPRAPSASTINRAQNRIGEAWLKAFNERLVTGAKGGSQDALPRSEPVWIVLE